jgi:non-heme chloroperoxidase
MGQPIILIHGTLSDFREWQFQIDKFAQNYRVISYSRRYAYPNQWIGNGEDNTIPNNVADLVELIIKRLNLGPAHVIGHSYGAFTALYLALEHPDLVKTLVLGEPPVLSLLEGNPSYYSKDIENTFRHSLVREAIGKADAEYAARIFLDGVIGNDGYFDQLPDDAHATIMDNVKSLSGELASIVTQRFTCENAQRLRVPTLLVKGELSRKLFHDIIDILAGCLPNNEQATIPGESHELGRIEKPEVFNTIVLRFLSKLR